MKSKQCFTHVFFEILSSYICHKHFEGNIMRDTKRLPQVGPETRTREGHQANAPNFNLNYNHTTTAERQSPSSQTSSSTLHSQQQLTPNSEENESAKMEDAASKVLSVGSLLRITQNSESSEEPVLQCVQIKPMASANGMERFRVVMSDSVNFMQGMLGQREFTCVSWLMWQANSFPRT